MLATSVTSNIDYRVRLKMTPTAKMRLLGNDQKFWHQSSD